MAQIKFRHQILIGSRVYGVGEEVEFPDLEAQALIFQGVAEPAVREAVNPAVKQARHATKKGRRRETRNSDASGD